MNKRNIWFYSSFVIFSLTLILLFTGSSVLTIPVMANNSIPLGTFITWAGMISLPLAIYWGVVKFRYPTDGSDKFLSGLLRIIIILALLWIPICYLLAGNLSFTFTEKESFQGGQTAMKWFWRFSYGLSTVPIVLLVTHWILRLIKK